MKCNLSCTAGENLLAQASLFSIEFARNMDSNEVLAWADFFDMVNANLNAIANRRIYREDPESKCCDKKGSKPKDPSKT